MRYDDLTENDVPSPAYGKFWGLVGEMNKPVKLNHQKLWEAADAAGCAAANRCTPRPMIVGTPTDIFSNDIDPTKKTYFVEGGVCGFAWVNIKPATSGFAKWLKASGKGRKSYYGGLDVWVSGYGQSMARKEAYASAFAQILNDHGITAYPMSRMD